MSYRVRVYKWVKNVPDEWRELEKQRFATFKEAWESANDLMDKPKLYLWAWYVVDERLI